MVKAETRKGSAAVTATALPASREKASRITRNRFIILISFNPPFLISKTFLIAGNTQGIYCISSRSKFFLLSAYFSIM